MQMSKFIAHLAKYYIIFSHWNLKIMLGSIPGEAIYQALRSMIRILFATLPTNEKKRFSHQKSLFHEQLQKPVH